MKYETFQPNESDNWIRLGMAMYFLSSIEEISSNKQVCVIRSLHPDTKNLSLNKLNRKVAVFTDIKGNIVAKYVL